MDNALYEKIRMFAAGAVDFSVADIMRATEADYKTARAAVAKMEAEKLAVYTGGVMFEYTGGVKKFTADDIERYSGMLVKRGDALDVLFCDAFTACAKTGKASAEDIKSALGISSERAQNIYTAMIELGVCETLTPSTARLVISYPDAEKIVKLYGDSRIIDAECAVTDASEYSCWSAAALEEAVQKQTERLCELCPTGDCEAMRAKVTEVMQYVDEVGDAKNVELCKAILEYLEKNAANENGRAMLYLKARRQSLIDKAALAEAGDDTERTKQLAYIKILDIFISFMQLANDQIAVMARKRAESALKFMPKSGLVDKYVADRIEDFTELDFYFARMEARKAKK